MIAQRLQMVREALTLPPESMPGTRYTYSNMGFVIAGAMLERITGEEWETLMTRELFEPLGMTASGFGTPGKNGSPDQPWGHDGRTPIAPGPNGDNPQALGPAGTVHTTLQDWTRFVAVHLAGAQGEGGLLDADTFEKLHTPAAGFEYALGWGVGTRNWAGGRVLQHAGSNTLWYAVVWIAPERNFAIIIATNQGGDDAADGTDRAAAALIERYNAG